jgi:hypothetical protein
MRGLSRWTGRGGSYRTIQRWFQTPLDWGMLLWVVVKTHLLDGDGQYILAGDDVVVSKTGKSTYGLGRFYSSIAQRPIPGLSFLTLSLVDIKQRCAYPLRTAQHQPASASSSQTSEAAPKKGRGRPKGSKNHAKPAPTLSADLKLLEAMLQAVMPLLVPLSVRYIALDGFFGTSPATWMVRNAGLHLISKLRHNAALYLPYTGPKPKRGPTPRYGDKLDYRHLPSDACLHSVTEGDICTDTYQLTVWHKDFANQLNVVVLIKTHIKSNKRAHVLLFSTDLSLSADQIVEYYSLRFQIEFNFRDAKQYWGLEDFMNVTKQSVTNAVNLSLLMVSLSAILLRPYRAQQPDFSVLDLKTQFRARRYLDETIKSLPDPPTADLISGLWRRFCALGGIRLPSKPPNAA